MQNFSIKNLLPHLLVLVVFIALSLIYLNPVLKGKEIRQGDIVNFKGMSKEIVDYREKNHEEPLWTNSMFGGMPAYQISVLYKGNLMKYVNSILMLGLPHPAGYLFLYFLGFYILCLTLRINPLLAGLGAIAFAFSSYFFIILEAGHNSKAHAIAYMAPVLGGIIITFRGKYLLGGMITGLFLALEIYANHLQITYYLFLIVLIYGIVELISAIKAKTLNSFARSTGVLIIAAILAASCSAGNLMCTYEYGKYTTRGKSDLTLDKTNQTSGLDKDYATGWSYGKAETMSLLIPNFKGGGSGRIGDNKSALKNVDPNMRQTVAQLDQYWGDQPFTSGPVYAGAIVMFLCVLGLFIISDKLKWVLLLATILSIVLAWGRNFPGLTNFFLDYFPGYNKFRAVSMILVIAELCIPLIAVLALNRLLETPNLFSQTIKISFVKNPTSIKKLFYISFGLTGGVCLLLWITPGTFTTFQKADEFEQTMRAIKQSNPEANQQQITSYLTQLLAEGEKAREVILKEDALRSLILILLAAGLIWLVSKSKVDKRLALATLTIFILADMWPVDKRYLNNDNFINKTENQNPFKPTAADEQILQDKDPNYRVFNLTVNTFNDASTSYYHKSIGGYHGAKLKRYQELIEYHLSKNNIAVLNMLNTRYFIVPGQQGEAVVQRNVSALGNAWFVNEAKYVANADSEIMALNKFEPKTTAIIDQQFKEALNGLAFKPLVDSLSKNKITLTEYKPNYLAYESAADAEQLAVFSEIYYPKGWNAYIDGKPSEHVRANYVLRAMRIPAGTHKVEFKFEPSAYKTGEKISMAGSALLLLLCIGIGFVELKKLKS